MFPVSVRQFRIPSRDRSESFLSYCVYEPTSREALIIDPHLGAFSEYSEFISSHRLTLLGIVETQLHFSHPTAARALSRLYETPVLMSELTDSQLPDRKLGSGERIRLGEAEISVHLTPGVRPDALCLSSSKMLFTGQTLWLGVSSAFGYPGADIGALFQSLEELRLRGAPADLIYSGYDVQNLMFSNWKAELEKNPDLLARELHGLQELKATVPVLLSEDFLEFGRFNSDKNRGEVEFRKFDSPFHTGNLKREFPNYSKISAEKLSQRFSGEAREQVCLVDVRDPGEFKAGHIPAARNIPLSELSAQVDQLTSFQRVYLACQLGHRSLLAASTLSYIGMKDIVALIGGIQAWQNAGLPVAKEA